MAAFCTKVAIRRAANTLNVAFSAEALPSSVKIELGLMLLLTGLHEVDDADRPALVAKVLGRLVLAPPAPAANPQIAAAQTALSRRGDGPLH